MAGINLFESFLSSLVVIYYAVYLFIVLNLLTST